MARKHSSSLRSSHLHSIAAPNFSRHHPALRGAKHTMAQETAERLIAFCPSTGFPSGSLLATYQHGWAMAEQGRHEDGIAQIRGRLAGHRATGARIGHAYFLCSLAAGVLEGRSFRRRARRFDGSAGHRGATGRTRTIEAEIHRLKGELLLTQNNSNAAEAQSCFERAIEIARKHRARNLGSCARR